MHKVLSPVIGHTLVSVRVHMNDRQAAAAALALPTVPHAIVGVDPSAFSLAPDQWLLSSATRGASDLIAEVQGRLAGRVFIATDVTSAFRHYRVSSQDAARLLATGSGVDFDSLTMGQGVRTRFANIGLIALRITDGCWDLYVDISHASYFERWLQCEIAVASCEP